MISDMPLPAKGEKRIFEVVKKETGEKEEVLLEITPYVQDTVEPEVYTVAEGLGIEAKKTESGFEITEVEERSDAAMKGFEVGDIITEIDDIPVREFVETKISQIPVMLHEVKEIKVVSKDTGMVKEVELESKPYAKVAKTKEAIKETGVITIKITQFTQVSFEEVEHQIEEFGLDNIKYMILDVRNNEGGPPITAAQLLGFFVTKGEGLFWVEQKNRTTALVRSQGGRLIYTGPMIILVNKRTGSAAEIVSGVLQSLDRANIVGQKTLGITYLKTFFDLEDGSTLFMITKRLLLPDKSPFPEGGLAPDTVLPEETDSLTYVLNKTLTGL